MLYIWCGVITASMLVELMSKNFTSVCFALSALFSAASTMFTGNYIIQVSIFLITGIFLLIVVRPNILTYLTVEDEKVKKSVKNKKKK